MKPKISKKYNVPYCGGYNISGTVIYIDKRIPKKVPGTTIDVDYYLSIHEEIEQKLEDSFKLKYKDAHYLATVIEHAALARDGHSNEDRLKYDEFWKHWVEVCRNDFHSIPPDLDLDPYIQCKDIELLKQMKEIEPELLLKGK